MVRRNKTWPSGLALSSLLVAISSPLQPSLANAGKSFPNFSVQFNAETSFAPNFSVPPQDENYGAYLVMPPCVGSIKNDCIMSVDYKNSRGEWIKGSFKEYLPVVDLQWGDTDFKNDFNSLDESVFAKPRPRQNFPAGGRTSVWELPGAKHSGGITYAVNLGFGGAASNITNPRAEGSVISWSPRDGFSIKLYPISYEERAPSSKEKSCGGVIGNKARYSCADTSIHPFPSQTKFRINANFEMTKTILQGVSWYNGRIINAQLNQSKASDGSVNLSIEGSPTTVGTVLTTFPKNQSNFEVLRKAIDAYWAETFGEPAYLFRTYEEFEDSTGSGFSTKDPGTNSAWRILEERFKFEYIYEEETWQVATSRMSNEDRNLTQKCGSSNLLPGIISTNAVAANPSPPKWNPEARELTYSISSPHTRKDGSLNVGVYELTIDKKLAECLWGSDPLQYRAAISVTATDGTQKVATTLFSSSEKFLSFRAAGFPYSTSLIRVKLNKKTGKLASKSSLPDLFQETLNKEKPVASSPSRTPITCVKGKTIKKVSTKTCPKGFKKS
jgi:hypothetical protein